MSRKTNKFYTFAAYLPSKQSCFLPHSNSAFNFQYAKRRFYINSFMSSASCRFLSLLFPGLYWMFYIICLFALFLIGTWCNRRSSLNSTWHYSISWKSSRFLREIGILISIWCSFRSKEYVEIIWDMMGNKYYWAVRNERERENAFSGVEDASYSSYYRKVKK